MPLTYAVYLYRNTHNGKIYVGLTKTSLQKRAGKDGSFYRGSPLFFAAIRKYGWSSFEGTVIRSGLSKKQAAAFERWLIVERGSQSRKYGYNLHRGGFETRVWDVATEARRVAKIRATLVRQRADPTVRKHMRARMLLVWSNPEQRKLRLSARRLSSGGRSPVRVECLETGSVYPNLSEVCRVFGMSKAALSKRLVESAFRSFRTSSERCVQLRKCSAAFVDSKRGELLEKP